MAPLADQMRPRDLSEIVGQEHLSRPDSPLRLAIASGSAPSLLLWGPPGTGKTTIALALAKEFDAEFEQMSAVTSGIKDLREIIKRAQDRQERGENTLLFIDEIHRWNKSQQDALLPHVESGTITLVGATTENPGFEINKALLSRCKLYLLKPLDQQALKEIIARALSSQQGLGAGNYKISEEAIELLLLHADGDARAVLNGLESAAATISADEEIGLEVMEQALGRRQLAYDKDGDNHHDVVSAFIKSIRGSDVDASLYYLAKMEAAGEDPKFVARRLVISASEDIGMADSQALTLANAGFEAVTKIGAPECWIHLAHVTAYLATTDKSWKSYKGWRRAQEAVANRPAYPIPLALRNPSNFVTKKLGHGQGYVHASEGDADMQFLPDQLNGVKFYNPDE